MKDESQRVALVHFARLLRSDEAFGDRLLLDLLAVDTGSIVADRDVDFPRLMEGSQSYRSDRLLSFGGTFRRVDGGQAAIAFCGALKFHGSSRSISELAWPAASASSVAFM